MDRRTFIRLAGGAAAGVAVTRSFAPAGAQPAAPPGPFTLGVASGDPLPDGVVLWTRLAPDPLVPGGGMPAGPVTVDWEVASNDTFRRIVRRGTAVADPAEGHSVHVEVTGLHPGADYTYRFRAGSEISPTGRTRTAPAPEWRTDRARFAFASCQHYETGYYTAYGNMVGEDLDFVVFLGDYIYEGPPNAAAPRQHDGTAEPLSLDDYRARHARYKSDPNLQAAHAAFPWFVTLDDHEIDNNWADEIPQDPDRQPRDAFLARRAAALAAYWEHMPLRRSAKPTGIDMRLFRRYGWGRLLQVDVLDTRQYRSDQPADLSGANDPAATMLGAEQEAWLDEGMATSPARWNVIAQQTMVSSNDRRAGPEEVYDFDNWDGYRPARRRLLTSLARARNAVVITGDRHATWVSDLKADFYDPASATLAAEITGTSITSGGDPNTAAFHATYDPIMADSPHWKFIDNQRGYMLCDVDRHRWLTDLRVVPTVLAPEAPISTFARFVTEDRVPGVAVA